MGKRLFVAIPLMNELHYLPALLKCIQNQDFRNFFVCYCVNQPDSWWDDEGRKPDCLNNQQTIEQLSAIDDHDYLLVDKSSKGNGWNQKKSGVGWARKTAMDACSDKADEGDILLSLDGDTRFNQGYFASVMNNFREHPEVASLAVPYFHELVGNEELNRAMLRYEIYMRYYALQLWRIGSPYSFTALGSAIAVRMNAYRKIGGMTPMKSGEDFYFLQKLRKYSSLSFWNSERVYPATRLSDRVFFGTGPALIKGIEGDWGSYPLYSSRLFNLVRETYDLFPGLSRENLASPMDEFLKEIFREDDIWTPLRKNNPTQKNFIRACHEKVDALRILQFLKSNTENNEAENICNLKECLRDYYPYIYSAISEKDWNDLDFKTSEISKLDNIRLLLASIEEKYQKENYYITIRK